MTREVNLLTIAEKFLEYGLKITVESIFRGIIGDEELIKVSQYYTPLNSEVVKILSRDHRLIEFLLGEAHERIREYFPDAELVLDYDGGLDTGDETLVVYIKTSKEPEEALKILEKFDEEWWISRSSEYSNLCIHLWLE